MNKKFHRRDIEIAADQRAKQHEHSTAGAEADAHLAKTHGSDLKQHNQKDENFHQDGKEWERKRQIMGLVDVHRKSSAAPRLWGAPASFACFLRGHDRFFSNLTCPFNVVPLIKKVRRNVEFDALMKRD
jgi:hypothetical protein